ncbi:hypothetical protein ACGC1H_002472 [Rhizoctonia solani]|uniref:F-box domain-containing protein n=1 Tax=Rhizoctonia solani TaxID=456999 RepID=A0A8H3BDN6_9AGAM|nr:unnamed protein product [Rhizoctonia solani]
MNQDTTAPPVYQSVKLWEEAGAQAATALSKYLELSLSLERHCLLDATPPAYLAARIDSALSSLHSVLNHHISEARSTLAQTRNRVRSPIYCFPEEVLSEIFSYAVSNAAESPFSFMDTVDATVIKTHHQLHTLLGVCSVWRNIALNQTELWTVVPIVNTLLRTGNWIDAQFSRIITRSIERAGTKGLHLAVTQSCNSRVLATLRDFTSRFHTVNIDAGELTISHIMDMFLHPTSPTSPTLSQLSLRQEREPAYFEQIPREFNSLFGSSSDEQSSFADLVQNLSALRISGVQLSWDRMSFSQQLTELLLHNVLLGYDSKLNLLSDALSAATELQDLKLISVRTFYDFTIDTDVRLPYAPTIFLPNLQTFVIQDLYFNTLKFLFSLLNSSCSHCLTLVLNEKGESVHYPGFIQAIDREDLDQLVLSNDIPLDTLFIDWGLAFATQRQQLSALGLGSLIRSVPTLEKLYLRWFTFNKEYCEAIKRPSQGPDSDFPHLTELYLHMVKIQNKTAFKAMIASHLQSLEYLEVGGTVVSNHEDPEELVTIEEDEELVTWLTDNDLSFRIVYGSHCPRQFDKLRWLLW